VLMDTDGSVAAQYRVRGIPHFVLIDARGKIQFVQIGYGPGIEQRFESELQKAIRASK
jgi:thioredoxin-related protein